MRKGASLAREAGGRQMERRMSVESYHDREPGYSQSLTSTRAVFRGRSENAGCTYKDRKYGNGDEVATSQACLSCSCRLGFVSCYRRVCPTLTAPYNDASCYLAKEAGSCCSVLKCKGVSGDKRKLQYPSSSNHIERKSEPSAHNGPTRTTTASPSKRPMSNGVGPNYWSQVRTTSSTAWSKSRLSTSRPRLAAQPTQPTQRSSSSASTRWSTAAPTTIKQMSSAHRTTFAAPSTGTVSDTTMSRWSTRSPSPPTTSAHRIYPARQPPKQESSFFRMSAILI
ncbi:hypothetical protein HDE_09049 [Halotydeus destructor]|nr:hypothetical protein HDE_09049 [Halotydeus destructor]